MTAIGKKVAGPTVARLYEKGRLGLVDWRGSRAAKPAVLCAEAYQTGRHV